VSDKTLWRGDGSYEPPAHVTKVRDGNGDIVERNAHGWWWMTIQDVPQERSESDGWPWRFMTAEGPFVEVRSA
jgi:hypothetical protein